MNRADQHDGIGLLLRSRKPDPQPSPDLESRILRALARPVPAPRRVFSLRWLLLPPAVAAAMLAIQWQRPPIPAPAQAVAVAAATGTAALELVDPPVEAEFQIPALAELLEGNPMQAEVRALQRDAGRAGRFLINSLPSISERPN
jgi:hypothetical protein